MSSPSIGHYLIDQIYKQSTRHVFGVPGDFVLGFYGLLEKSKLAVINTCDEQGAGFAADAYARLNGLGVVVVTYGVGGLKVANTTAEAFAEKSPVLVISGAAGVKEQESDPLLHHRIRDFDTQKKIFDHLTVASAVLDDPETAFSEINRVIAAITEFKQPGYIELPRDMLTVPGVPHRKKKTAKTSDPAVLTAFLEEATAKINAARNPVVLAGVEIQRFGLQAGLLRFAEKNNIPIASSILGKASISEDHPLYLGVYEGGLGNDPVRKKVESSDCLIMLGAFLTDVNLGIYSAKLDPKNWIYVTADRVSIGYHQYENLLVDDIISALGKCKLQTKPLDSISNPTSPKPFKPTPNTPITIKRLFEKLDTFIDDKTVVISDMGDALFAAAELIIRSGSAFLSPAYYASIGFAVPASIGASLATPKLRSLVLVGDGAFQMTGMEISTLIRFGCAPIIVILNNQGYGTERPIIDGPFNDILNWDYSKLPAVFGSGKGFRIQTEDDLQSALTWARSQPETLCLLDVQLDKFDFSDCLKRMTSKVPTSSPK